MDEPARLKAAPGSALLRITALPVERSGPTRSELDLHDVAESECFLRDIVADPVVREAIAVSSSSLARTLDTIDAGGSVAPKKLRRAVLAVTSYLLRMTTRPTPFGLMAGVATARFGPRAAVRLGRDHRKNVRVDAGWLAAVVRHRESDLEVVRPLRVVLNNLCTVRGDRLVLAYLPSPKDGAERAPRELSVRYSALVREVARLARRPIRFADLVEQLGTTFEQATPAKLEPLLLDLVARQLLLTELSPPPSAADPLEYVLAQLPDDAALTTSREALRSYAVKPVGAGRSEWQEATAVVRGAGTVDGPPQVDLAYDASVTLPVHVAAEVERAASTLVRLTPSNLTPAHLRHYHLDFLERYGDRQLVPLLELLDAGSGLDAPAGYEVPLSLRPKPPADLTSRPEPPGRARLLGRLAQQAVLDGVDEIVLDDATLDRLAPDGADDRHPAELELGVEVVASSVAALEAGDFQIVVGGWLQSTTAGAIGGRFASLLGNLELGPPDPTGVVTAQVEFPPAEPRSANVTRVPRQLGHTLSVGLFTDPADPSVLGVDELLVGADHQRMYLWSARLGVEVVPATLHVLDSHRLAPNVVRFLSELAVGRQRACAPWDWGRTGELLPFLPRVRHGRIVLSPASWRPDPALADLALPDEQWQHLFHDWRKRWRVPTTAYLTVADNRIGIDLDAPLHQALLRHELSRRPEATLVETPAGSGLGTGWLAGHAHELVLTLRSRQPEPVASAPPVSTGRRQHYPGGEWIYGKLYAPEDRHQHLIAHSLQVLRSALPDVVDRWFFVRFRDPQPHLRIRLHGQPAALLGGVLPLLHDWAAELCAANLAQRLVLDTYEPEMARYGGPEVLDAAERAFHADSEAVVAQVRLMPTLSPALSVELLLAAGMVDLAVAYGEPGWRDWFLAAYPKDSSHSAFQAVRRTALTVVGERHVDPRLAEVWQRRAAAVRAYGDRVRARQPMGPPAGPLPLGSLLHMHHNRLAGITPDVERAAYAIVRGVLRAQLDRARAER